MRLFFAIELPSELQTTLGRLRPAESNEYRWSDPALLHVTLVFLGEQPLERLERLQLAGEAAAVGAEPGRLRLGEPGSFGPRRAPSVLWVGLGGDLAALTELHGRLRGQLLTAGVALPDDRPFRPHVTLARRRASAAPAALLNWAPPDFPTSAEFPMDTLTLFESRLSPRGSTYVPRVRLPLGAAPAS